ncbi:MAG: hypothetical protein MPL62_09940 [Alphaproteobacteria bacterium]|nr:hypothetical protein [Alphaproteobacteria bacterium]
MKPFLKPAAAALLSFTIAPLCAAQSPFDILSQDTDSSAQYMGFTEPGQASVIPKKVIPDDTPDDELTFSLDLYFGTAADAQPVRGIAPLILYNSNQIKVVGISNIERAGILRPARSKLKKYISDYTPVTPPALTTVGGESFTADVNKGLALIWLDRNGIVAVSRATPEQPVRVATIKFQWIPGAEDTSHIGITHSEFGVARIRGASIKVQGPVVRASVSSQTTSINVNAKTSSISVECSLSRPASVKTTCVLELALERPNPPPATTFKISIRAGKTSALKKLKVKPNAADGGSKFKITLTSAEPFEPSIYFAEIPLESPAVVVSKLGAKEIVKEITVEEGETEELRVRLAARPNGKVVVRARATRAHSHPAIKKVTVTPASLTFTAGNWEEQQTVRISSPDDKIADGDRFVIVKFVVNDGKSGATDYDSAHAASVLATITENDKATPVVTAAVTGRPDNILGVGLQQVVITATLEGGGVFGVPKPVTLNVRDIGSAEAGVHYAPFTLPNIIIPARAASASATFTINITSAIVNTIVIGVGVALLDPDTPAPDLYLKIGRFSLDVDANGHVNGADTIMIRRYLKDGISGPGLTLHQSHSSHEKVAAYIQRGERVLNVSALKPKGTITQQDINEVNAIVIARYIARTRGESLVKGLVPRPDPDTVEANIRALLP